MIESKLLNIGATKFAADDSTTDTRTFSGYGAAFGNVDSYGDVIEKGAFAKTIKSGEMPLLFLNHDPYSLPIGKWTSLEEDDFGLKVEGEFLDTAMGRDTYTASKAGAINGLSIGFRPTDVLMGTKKSDPVRTIRSLDLLEISVVTFPANAKARIGDVKSFTGEDDYRRELIRLGMSDEDAREFLKSMQTYHEHKYVEATNLNVARQLLSKLLGEK